MPIIAALVGLVLGAIAAIAYMRTAKQGSLHEADEKIQSAHAQAESLIGDAKRQAETLKKEALLEAKEEIIKNKQAAEAEDKQRKNEIRTLENRVMQREESLDRRNDALDKREHQLSSQAGQVEKRSRELEELCAKQTSELERIADLTREDAHKELLDKVRGEVTHEAATIIRESEQQVRAECHKTAQEILSLAIQRCAADHTAEVTVTSVHIPSDDLKGRIIGREGRNIRTFEQVSGVNLVIDDTPETVVLSSFVRPPASPSRTSSPTAAFTLPVSRRCITRPPTWFSSACARLASRLPSILASTTCTPRSSRPLVPCATVLRLVRTCFSTP